MTFDDLPDDIAEISNSLKKRIIEAYEVVSEAFKPDLSTINVTLTPMQCATILSSMRQGFKNAFGEDIPGSPKEDT
jgi:hypothetical protein